MTVYDENWVMARKNPNHGLTPLKTVLGRYGNPQDSLRIIHIAGTNGKGSTACYIRDVLQAHGYRTGLFSSPHLITHFDRITINGIEITRQDYRMYLNQCIDDIIAYDLGMFEIVFLIAMLYFKDRKIDWAVVECGLGGRLDNTNVISDPVISVITTIGSDHAALLGERCSQVAFEKAGIIRPHVPVCVGIVSEQAKTVISLCSQRKKSAIMYLGKIRSRGMHAFEYDRDVYHLNAQAQYQKENASLALMVLKRIGVNIHDALTKKAIETSMWKGRFERVMDTPAVYLDGAHNREGIDALLKNYPYLSHPVVTVFSALKDKPGKVMARNLMAHSDHMIITSISNARFESMDSLYVEGVQQIADENEAVNTAVRLAGSDGTVVICGSLYFISDIRKHFFE
ncbi:MAG: bifunctional folylpolyglutamate synthase/dihydrofolate synthase [Bulleidia sp.]